MPSCDENGHISWRLVEAVTRHPVVNADGTDTLLKVWLRSGREVVATKAKSFLKRVNNKIVPVEGADLVVGDYLPVSAGLCVPDACKITHLEVDQYLPRSEWLYGTEVAKAMAYRKDNGNSWWTGHPTLGGGNGVTFSLPYKRSDTVLAAFVGVPSRPAQRIDKVKEGCVYPVHGALPCAPHPRTICARPRLWMVRWSVPCGGRMHQPPPHRDQLRPIIQCPHQRVL